MLLISRNLGIASYCLEVGVLVAVMAPQLRVPRRFRIDGSWVEQTSLPLVLIRLRRLLHRFAFVLRVLRIQ